MRTVDFNLVESLLYEEDVKIENMRGYGRLERDIKEALENVLEEHLDMIEDIKVYKNQEEVNKNLFEEMQNHIYYLEKMLLNKDMGFIMWGNDFKTMWKNIKVILS